MSEVTMKYVARKSGEAVKSNRYHLFDNCSFLEGSTTEAVSDREVELLGAKECIVCTKRQTGGPAVEALATILSAEGIGNTEMDSADDVKDMAFNIVTALKGRGFYIAQRKPS